MKKVFKNWRKYFESFLSWAIIYITIALLWIGAEYTIEGIVHKSLIDFVVCAVLSGFVTYNITKKRV